MVQAEASAPASTIVHSCDALHNVAAQQGLSQAAVNGGNARAIVVPSVALEGGDPPCTLHLPSKHSRADEAQQGAQTWLVMRGLP